MINTQRPLDILGKAINTNVTVYLKDGSVVKGILKAYDIHINIVLENAKFNKEDREFQMIVIRGDNIQFVSL
ncbi:MAG TPA: small nuclear ribonucleoprotein [Methanothermococcus okinawensis]|uniref:Small nuclear ribonucleoprotein n=1 Tax=Methanofervidicoccus abyssi TaxID=2082189 RepID=A0A401HPJ6_9EURY|nr:LSM domain-containing protein [Methanofervidicoccus abyssi]GBF36186.1 small nuclear ribonucleoprotein [Methanofervidicoccus abyssi]HIP16025.1 small nuclear ribonucleoprotein [Methanothermococcus okinawensis]HIP35136.1 small nuclear ribonucleoprotein [Methanothermococcus okinawensis]